MDPPPLFSCLLQEAMRNDCRIVDYAKGLEVSLELPSLRCFALARQLRSLDITFISQLQQLVLDRTAWMLKSYSDGQKAISYDIQPFNELLE